MKKEIEKIKKEIEKKIILSRLKEINVMKIKEIGYNKPLEVTNVFFHFCITDSFGQKIEHEIDEPRIKTIILTDGQLAKIDEEKNENIKEFYIDGEKYPHDINLLKRKNIYLEDYNFIITCYIAKIWTRRGRIEGWFDTINDINVYLKDKNDVNVLEFVEEFISQVILSGMKVDCSSILSKWASEGKCLEQFESDRITEEVYSLKRSLL